MQVGLGNLQNGHQMTPLVKKVSSLFPSETDLNLVTRSYSHKTSDKQLWVGGWLQSQVPK